MSDLEYAERTVQQLLAEAAQFAAMWEEEMQLSVVAELARSTRDEG